MSVLIFFGPLLAIAALVGLLVWWALRNNLVFSARVSKTLLNVLSGARFYVVFNLIGLLFYAAVVEGIWAQIKSEERSPDFGDSLNFLFTAEPVFFLCFLSSVAWLVKALRHIFKRRDYRASVVLAIVAAAWVSLFIIIRQRH